MTTEYPTEYPRKSVGHILHYLRRHGIPETIAGTVTVGAGIINLYTKPFATYKYFEGIEKPLFRFQDKVFSQHRHTTDGKVLKSNFHLSLSVHNTPGLVVTGWDATQELRVFLKGMLTNMMSDPCYTLHQNAGAFFQGGHQDAETNEHGYIYIELCKSSGAQAFVDYLNANFSRQLKNFA